MKYYHGSKKKFSNFRTPTGVEVMDVTKGGVVYLTSDINVARRYAGNGGYVATVTGDVVSYRDQLAAQGRKKHNKYVRNVFVGLPSQLSIVSWERA